MVLGLDLGSYSVKAFTLDPSKKTRAFFSVRRPADGDRMETLKAALVQLLAEHPLKFEQAVVALPGPTLATHALSLPFSEPKRIEQALPFEIEAQLPFDLSEAVFDYQLAPSAEKKGEVLVSVVRKTELSSLLSTLAEAKVEPRIVTHPSIAFQILLIAHPALFKEGAPIGIVDIGHERTCLAIGQSAVGLSFARTFSGGGKDLTRALATEFNTTLEDAEQWKISKGKLGQAGTPDGDRSAGVLQRGLQPILRELRASLKSAAAKSRQETSILYLCGGTSLLPGISEQLSSDLGLPVQLLTLPEDLGLSPHEERLFAEAYSLALRGQMSGGKAPRFNLRRGEFAFKGHYDYLKERWGRLSLYAAALLGLFIVSGVLRNAVLASREARVDEALCQVTQRVLGKCEKNFDRALSMLRGKESPAAALPQVSAVNLLAELTAQIPADVPVKFEQIAIDLDRISLRGETDSSKQIDRITSALRGHHCFKDVKEGKVERSKDGQKVNFRLDIQVDCPEDGQG